MSTGLHRVIEIDQDIETVKELQLATTNMRAFRGYQKLIKLLQLERDRI